MAVWKYPYSRSLKDIWFSLGIKITCQGCPWACKLIKTPVSGLQQWFGEMVSHEKGHSISGGSGDLVTKSVWLCNLMDCSLLGSSVHEIYQLRILEWVAISFSMGSSQLRDWTRVSCLAGGFYTTEPPVKPFTSILCKVMTFTFHILHYIKAQSPSHLSRLLTAWTGHSTLIFQFS